MVALKTPALHADSAEEATSAVGLGVEGTSWRTVGETQEGWCWLMVSFGLLNNVGCLAFIGFDIQTCEGRR